MFHNFKPALRKILLKNDLKPSVAGKFILFYLAPGGIFHITLRQRGVG